jgi:diguanylate cyclase (GGDEF)-like protein
MQTGNGPLSLTASIGVSQTKPDDQSLEDVVRRADEALYIAKQEGRNRVILERPAQPFSA